MKGFSFTNKKWGELSVDRLSNIEFDQEAFLRLVLPDKEKEILRAIVQYEELSKDLISGKGGGLFHFPYNNYIGRIILLHGPPGVGKTLTAEAIAEFLRKPLYSISVGELGTKLERNIGSCLNLGFRDTT